MNTTLPTFLDALRAALAIRAGLAQVNVFTCPVSPDALGEQAIEFANGVDIEQRRLAMSETTLDEEYAVPGSIIAFRTAKQGTQATNSAAKLARDRVDAILEEVVDEITTNDTMSGTVRDVTISGQHWTQGMAPEGRLGRYCRVEFTLTVTASVTP